MMKDFFLRYSYPIPIPKINIYILMSNQ